METFNAAATSGRGAREGEARAMSKIYCSGGATSRLVRAGMGR